ncbi:MAG: PilN domain-containing protein [Actinomycetota bacterium]
MALATRPRKPEVGVNLLPPQIRSEQRKQRTYRTVVIGVVVFGVLLLAVTAVQRLQISGKENTLREQRAQAASLQGRVEELREFESMQNTIDENRKILSTALRNDVSWARFLDDLDTSIPADAWVTGLTLNAKADQTPMGDSSLGTAQYQGYVLSFPGLSGWMNKMEDLDGLQFVYLSTGNKVDLAGRKVVNFTATAHLTQSMLSGRCQQEGAQCP